MKQKFYKNLFQTMSYFAVIMILEVFLLIGFFASLSYGQNFGWILLIISRLFNLARTPFNSKNHSFIL